MSVATQALPSVDVWHHLTASYGGGSYRRYVDGVLGSRRQHNRACRIALWHLMALWHLNDARGLVTDSGLHQLTGKHPLLQRLN